MISIYNSVESPIKDIEILGNTVDGVSVGILQDDGQYKITLFTNNGLDNMSPDYREDKEELLLPCQLEKIGDSTDRLYYDKEEKAWCIYKVSQSKIVLPITFTISLNSFYGTTNLYMVSGEVEGTIKAKVSKSLGASVSSLNDKADVLIDKIDAMLGGRVDLDGYATIEYVDVKDGEIKGVLDNMFEEYTEEQISVDFPNASTISIVDNDDLFTSTTIEGALRELASNSSSGIGEAIEQNKNDISDIKNELSKTENTSYTTENGVKEFECKDGYVDNVVIEGKTLVNIVSMVVVNGADSDGVVRTRFSNLGDNYKFYPRTQKGTFTLMNHTDKGIWFVGMTSSDTWAVESFYVEPFSARVVTLDGSRCINGVDFQPASGWSNSDLSIYKSSMYSILEGEYDYIPYFEGLKSVGQGDKIEVLSNNKNLCDPQEIKLNWSLNASGIESEHLGRAVSGYCSVQPNTYYIMSGNGTSEWYYIEYDINKKLIGNRMSTSSGEFITSPNTKYVRFFRLKISDNALTNISEIQMQLEEGTVATEYTPHKSDKKQISATLRSLPNGVKDTIEKQGNKYYKIKRCGEVVITGGDIEGKYSSGETTNTLRVYTPLAVGLNVKTNSVECNHFISDKFKSELNLSQETTDVDSLSIKVGGEGRFVFRLSKSKLPTQDLDGAKTWLSQNPVTVVYELATPIIEELPNFNPQTFSDKTTLLLNSGVVQGEASFEVTNSLGSELEVLKNIVSDLDDDIYKLCAKDNLLGVCHQLNGVSLNQIFKYGSYAIRNPKDCPITSAVYLEVINLDNNTTNILQRITGATKETYNSYYRVKNGESWASWKQITTTSTLSLLEQQISELEIQAMERGI